MVLKKFEKRFEVWKFFVRTNQRHGLSEQSADCSEEPTRCLCPKYFTLFYLKEARQDERGHEVAH